MKSTFTTSALFLALFLSACSSNSSVDSQQAQSSSSAGVRVSVVGLDVGDHNVLAGSTSSADDVSISGYQVEANKLFRSKYEGMERQQYQDANQHSYQNGGQMNGYDNSYNYGSTSSSVYGQFTYDANGNLINGSNTSGNGSYNGSMNGSVSGNGSMNGSVNGSLNGSNNSGNASGNFNNAFNNSNGSGNRSTYSYITSCSGQSFLQRLGLEGQCGSPGWTFPGLVDGNCPVTACILNVNGDTPFGPL